MHVLVAGCGWLGTAVALRLLERGDRVTGVRSTAAGAEALGALGIEGLAVDLTQPGAEARIPAGVEAILALQAARGAGVDAYRQAYLEVNRTLLRAARERSLRALVHSGSTGIFGQQDGSDVDERTPPQPGSGPGQVLAEAEALLLDAARQGLPTRLVRLSGLYGPGRTWMLERVRAGQMGLGPGDAAWINACHQDDAVSVLLAALDRGRDGAIYHGSDALPMRRGDLVRHIAGRLRLVPAQVPAAPGGPNRRVLAVRTRAELDLRLRWPSLREGLEPFLDQPLP